jgi:phenylalanyl-tRNA synthetase beta chain
VTYLLEGHGWRRVGTTGKAGAWRDPVRQIPIEIGGLAGFLEHPLTEEEIRLRLSRYGFRTSPPYPDWDDDWNPPARVLDRHRDRLRNTLLVQVPPHRLWDVEYAADLAEELAKSIGYNAAPGRLPPVGMGALPTRADDMRARVEDVLLGLGFYEVITDGFYGREVRDRWGIGPDHPLHAHIETSNSVDRGYSLLKNNALAQAVEAVATNLRLRTQVVKAYEWTRTFHPDPSAENGACRERRLLWLIACGPVRAPSFLEDPPVADTAFLKGVLAEIAAELGIDLVVGPADPGSPLHTLLHPNRQATIRLGGAAIGVLGEVHPAACLAHKIKRERPIYLEIDASTLSVPGRSPTYHEPPDHLPIERDLALTLSGHATAGEVAAHLKTAGPSWLEDVRVTDLYAHDEGGRPVRTVTFALRYSSLGGSLQADDVNRATDALIRSVEAKCPDVRHRK